MSDPRIVMIAGDMHGNVPSIISNATEFRNFYPDEEELIIVHCGDFEFFMGGWSWWSPILSRELVKLGVKIYSIDGNHEHHARLRKLQKKHGMQPIETAPNIFWLPRGYMWNWNGQTWMACGGAHSVDRKYRTEGTSWFASEEISDKQEEMMKSSGKIDVMISHDCPSEVVLSGLPNPVDMGWPWEDIYQSNLHRERLQRITMATQPGFIFHGHFHIAYAKIIDIGYGDIMVTGINWSGEYNNHLYFDTVNMKVVNPNATKEEASAPDIQGI